MKNYRIVLKVNLKKLQTLRTVLFASHKQGKDMPTWTIASIWDFHFVFDYFSKNRYGSAVFIFLSTTDARLICRHGNNSWKIYTTNLI